MFPCAIGRLFLTFINTNLVITLVEINKSAKELTSLWMTSIGVTYVILILVIMCNMNFQNNTY